jgi:hypothetical protein
MAGSKLPVDVIKAAAEAYPKPTADYAYGTAGFRTKCVRPLQRRRQRPARPIVVLFRGWDDVWQTSFAAVARFSSCPDDAA